MNTTIHELSVQQEVAPKVVATQPTLAAHGKNCAGFQKKALCATYLEPALQRGGGGGGVAGAGEGSGKLEALLSKATWMKNGLKTRRC